MSYRQRVRGEREAKCLYIRHRQWKHIDTPVVLQTFVLQFRSAEPVRGSALVSTHTVRDGEWHP